MDPGFSVWGVTISVRWFATLNLIKFEFCHINLSVSKKFVFCSKCTSNRVLIEKFKLAIWNYFTFKDSIQSKTLLAAEGNRFWPWECPFEINLLKVSCNEFVLNLIAIIINRLQCIDSPPLRQPQGFYKKGWILLYQSNYNSWAWAEEFCTF